MLRTRRTSAISGIHRHDRVPVEAALPAMIEPFRFRPLHILALPLLDEPALDDRDARERDRDPTDSDLSGPPHGRHGPTSRLGSAASSSRRGGVARAVEPATSAILQEAGAETEE